MRCHPEGACAAVSAALKPCATEGSSLGPSQPRAPHQTTPCSDRNVSAL
jgi:hypothetical protein